MGSTTLHIQLLGGVELRLDGVALLPLESARAESLLAYLLMRRDAPQSRQHLAFLLWPDSNESQARTNLRHVLHTLRHALPEPDHFLAKSSRTLQWRNEAHFWLDVAAFDEALARGERVAPDDGVNALRDAVALYSGDLVPGCYDEWLAPEREHLRQRYLDALGRLTALLEARHELAAALDYAERLQREDPLDEETYRLLMRLHDARGNRARALQVYHLCAATLERELGVEPSSRTREAYEALLPAERDTGSSTRAETPFGGMPLVGRAAEWTHLVRLWRATEQGRAQLVLVSGEPGIGKTRLIEELRLWCAQRGAVTAVARSYPAEGALAYGPLVAWLRSDAVQARIARLDRPRLTDLARILPELGAEGIAPPSPEPHSESEYRLRLFDAVAQAILGSGNPLLLVAEDLHWWDQQSLQFLHYLLRTEPDTHLLVAASARREEIDRRHPLHDLLSGVQVLERFTEIPLGRLTPDETALLAAHASGRPLARDAADQIYGQTEGNPLFIVETLRAGWPARDDARQGLPAKVQAVIESRLGQLSDQAQDLAGIAATVGREFTPDVLAGATGSCEEALLRALDELWRRRIIREQGAHAYDFSHDKIREVA
jgi:DNA-binding SARP family transcriptional activator